MNEWISSNVRILFEVGEMQAEHVLNDEKDAIDGSIAIDLCKVNIIIKNL